MSGTGAKLARGSSIASIDEFIDDPATAFARGTAETLVEEILDIDPVLGTVDRKLLLATCLARIALSELKAAQRMSEVHRERVEGMRAQSEVLRKQADLLDRQTDLLNRQGAMLDQQAETIARQAELLAAHDLSVEPIERRVLN
jgi:hypothetical protein